MVNKCYSEAHRAIDFAVVVVVIDLVDVVVVVVVLALFVVSGHIIYSSGQ